MANQRIRLRLYGNNWNGVNPMLKRSEWLVGKIEEATAEIKANVLANIDASGSPSSARMKTLVETADPRDGRKIPMGFVSLPLGFEAKYNVLGKATAHLGQTPTNGAP